MAEEKREPEKREKRQKKSRKIFTHYKIGEGRIKRLLPFCERCGPGYFMADHGDRYACGRCGFTRYKPGRPGKPI